MEYRDMTAAELEARKTEISAMIDAEDADLDALEEEARAINKELERRVNDKAKKEEIRKAVAEGTTETIVIGNNTVKEERKMSVIEERAARLVEEGKMTLETRQLLSTGTLTGTKVKSDIGELPTVISSIVDDVDAEIVDGIGTYAFAYENTEPAAAAVTEGSNIGGTAGSFSHGSITPSTWGILDSISRLVSKKSPIAYEQAIKNRAYIALRKKAKANIVTAVMADALADKTVAYTLDANFVRNLVLGFNADEAVAGGTKLYLCKEDLQTLGHIRGTNEKAAVFEITFTDENNGYIKDGGLSVAFSICSDLKGKGASSGNAMIYGQPKAIKMPLWGNYEISTDEGGKYFDANLTGIRGLQTAGVGIVRKNAIQVINA